MERTTNAVVPYRPADVDSLPPLLWPGYRSTVPRAPSQPLLTMDPTLTEVTGPLFGHRTVRPEEADLTRQHRSEPQGQRIVVAGRVLDGDGRPVRRTLVEVWQANAAGRYALPQDQHPAPLDPNFTGVGRCLTDDEGRYRFVSVQPGAYPWLNHPNAWRPAHIHFSLFGPALATRLITQMYFPGDPLFAYDPIMASIRDEAARARMVSTFDLSLTEPQWALGYNFDIVLRGRAATPMGI
jgi:protocatechuate 3,4-dioxygenase beta subunit